MFSNLKTSDWIAAAISGITPVATALIGNALSGAGEDSGAGTPGPRNSVLDYADNVVGNLDLDGFEPLSPLATADDPVRTWAEINEAGFADGIDVGAFVGSAVMDIPTEGFEPVTTEPNFTPSAVEPVNTEGDSTPSSVEPITVESRAIPVEPYDGPSYMPTVRTGDDPTSLPTGSRIE